MRALATILALALTAQSGESKRSIKPGSLQLGSSAAKRSLTPELALRVRWPQSAIISPDGLWIAMAVKEAKLETGSWETQLYVQSTRSGGELRQLTFAGASNAEPAWSPDSRRIAFTSTREDSAQIYVLDLASGGEAKRLTHRPTGASAAIWSPDGTKIAFTSEVYLDCRDDACDRQKLDERARTRLRARAYDELFYRHWNSWDEGTRSHLFIIPADGSEPARDLTPGKIHVPSEALCMGRGFAFAGNDAIVYCANTGAERAVSTNNDLFLVYLNGDPPRPITTNKALDANPEPSPDGAYIAYLAHARAGFEADKTTLVIYEKKTARRIERTASFDRSAEELAWMPDASGLYFTAYQRGKKLLYAIARESGEPAAIVTGRTVTQPSTSKQGSVSFVSSAYDAPPEVFLYDPSSRETRRVSRLNDALLATLELGATDELELDAGGGAVHGFVTYPPAFRPENRYPLVLLIHGGPQSAWVDAWHARWNAQLFSARGYVVAMPNFRGSTGYGQKFTDAVTKDWAGGAYADVTAFTDALANKPFIDERWMCAAGASYGGYLVNWIAGHSQRFRCLITHAGIFNLESMWGDTEELWFPEWEMGGTPWSAREEYRRWSPHEYIQNAKTPVLVTHGALDFRVHLSQGQQMFTSLRRLGVPARFVYFPDEGHWISKPQNYVYWYNEMLGWLSRYLR